MITGLETKNLSFSYNGRNVIEDITFSAGSGETWAFIGRNGAGKSTLIKCLCGLLKSRERGLGIRMRQTCGGAVFINGIDIAELTPKETARQIAYVPQGVSRLPPPFSVREYLTMARYPYGGRWAFMSHNDKSCVDEALVLTETSHLADRMMNTLSGGELQSALIAGAVAQNTPFLLLDEPTTYLDPYHQENVRMIIERIHTRRGVTVITVTHDINFALSAHNNILSLIDGKVFFCGTKKDFCNNAEIYLSTTFSVDFRAVRWSNRNTFYLATGGIA